MTSKQAWIFALAVVLPGLHLSSPHPCIVKELDPPETGLFVNCSGQKLSAIPEDLPYTNVTILDLSLNKFGDLENQIFSNFSDLKNLTLAGNQITSYSAEAFDGLESLGQLDLSLNWMEQMPYSLCEYMPQLNNLTVNFATLGDKVTGDVFSKCQELRIIYMAQSGLSDIQQIFTNLPNLESLYLSDCNSLSIQDTNAFQNNPKLTVLDLRGMATAGLSTRFNNLPAAIRQVKTLKVLRVSKSVFTTFSKDDTKFFDQLVKLYGTGNPYTCDCSTSHLITWMQGADNIEDGDQWDCHASCANCPPSYLMKDYNVDTCDGVVNKTGNILVLVALVVVACIIAAGVIVGVVVMKRKQVACFAKNYARM